MSETAWIVLLRDFARYAVDWLKPRMPDGFVAPYSALQVRTALLAGADALEQLQTLRDQSREEVSDGRRLGLEGRAPATTAAPPIDEFCRTCRDVGQSTPAAFIVWGKLFPTEALGPRCYHHAAQQIGASSMVRIDQWAVYDLRPIQAFRDKIADLEVHTAELHDLLRELHERGPTRALHAKITAALAVQPPPHRQQLQDRVEWVADERDHFQAGMHRMREALTGLRQGRMTGEQANDEFFDGYQQAKEAFAAALLVRDVKAAALDQGEAQPRQLFGYQTSDGRLYQPEDITLVYTPGQGEAQEEYDAPIIAEPITQADRDLVRKATSTDLTGVEILPQFDQGEAQGGEP